MENSGVEVMAKPITSVKETRIKWSDPKFEADIQKFRKLVEIAWNKNTAYPSLKDDPGTGRFKSLGQCAVTSRLLEDYIKAQYSGKKVKNVEGKVYRPDGSILADNHAWVEIEQDDGDSIVIDVTADQKEGLGESAPPVIMGKRSELVLKGYKYTVSREDTDEKMKESDAFSRFELLRHRFEQVLKNEEYYDELLHGNIYIIGPAGSGKTTLINELQNTLPHSSVDVGKLFRVISYIVLHDPEGNAIKPDIEKLVKGDSQEMERIINSLWGKKRLINEGFSTNTKLQKGSDGRMQVNYYGKELQEELETREINTLVGTIAKSPQIRDTVWSWICKYASCSGGVILTGHTLKDINTSKFSIIHMKVDPDIAALRESLFNPSAFPTAEEAKIALERRNALDGMPSTERILDKLHAVGHIDTSDKTPSEVKLGVLRYLVKRAKERAKRKIEQNKSGVQRDAFTWEVNPCLALIRSRSSDIINGEQDGSFGKEIFEDAARKYHEYGITEFDIAVQTMIHLSAYPPEEVWQGDKVVIGDILSLIKIGEVGLARESMLKALSEGTIKLNTELVNQESERQAKKLRDLFENTKVEYKGQTVNLPAKYMGNPDLNPFKDTDHPEIAVKGKEEQTDPESGEKIWQVREQRTGKKIIFKRVPKEISNLYSKGFHYLHEGRSDERAAYGAYLEGDDLPYAWVSYSPVDRSYKREMLDHYGTEPHTMLEMTRAWNSSWAPKNTMSVLFSYAHTVLQDEWKKEVAKGSIDKPLQGIVTAINPNLGFHANAFNGVGFVSTGLKPALFTFLRTSDGFSYMPRRSIQQKLGLATSSQLTRHPDFSTSQIPLVDTVEMVLFFDKAKEKGLLSQPMYRIQNEHYLNA